MESYLDLRTGRVYKPPCQHILDRSTIVESALPINKQLYFLKWADNNIIAYAPYDRIAALINKDEYQYLLTHPVCDERIPKDLTYGRFYSEDNTENFIYGVRIPNFSPTELTVFLGDACNLSCVYCNAIKARDGESFDPRSTIDAVKIILKNYSIKHISFFGNGEPSLYFKTLEKIVKLAEKQDIKSFYIATSGVFGNHTKEYVNFLVKHNIYTQISIDGYKKIHNLQRPMPNGEGSFDYVIQTINGFKKYGDLNKYCLARFTLSEYAARHLKKIILFLYRTGFRKIRFAELVPEGRAEQQMDEFTRSPNPLKIVDEIVEIFLLADNLGINLTGDYDPRSPSESGIFSCPYMGGKAISLNKNLKILSCLEDYDEWVIGEVNLKKEDINKNKLKILQERNMLAFKECESCPVKCGGGCTHYSYLVHKSIHVPGDYKGKCELLKLILAKYLIAKLKGGEEWKNSVSNLRKAI